MFDDLCSRKGQSKMQMRVGLLQMADCGPRKEDLQAKGEASCRDATGDSARSSGHGRGYRALSRNVVYERPSFRQPLLETRLRTLERKAPVGQSRVASRPGVRGADSALARAGHWQRRSVYHTLSTISAGVAHGYRPHLPGTLAGGAARYGVADRPARGDGADLRQGAHL